MAPVLPILGMSAPPLLALLGHQSGPASDWPITLAAALGGAAVGAGLGGWSASRARVRGGRSDLYNDLHKFHDDANDRRRGVAKGHEPVGIGELGELFRKFDRDAATTSRFDSHAVRAIWPMLNRIDEVAATYARRDVPNAQAVALARSLADDQLKRWDELVNYLWHYRRWLEWKAKKPWWSIPRDVRRGPIGPEEATTPPRRLR